MTRPVVCALCNYISDRTDHVVRHMRLCHTDKTKYEGHNELTGYTFLPVGNDFPHIVMATHPTRQAIGYCTQCFVGFHAPHSVKNPANLAKHFKAHTCAEKQTRTRKVTVTSEDVSGNIITKKEMQTGGVTITEETLTDWKKQYPRFEIKFNDNLSQDIMGSLRKAVIDSHLLDAVRVQQKQAPAVEAAPVSGDIYLQVMQSFVGDGKIGAIMSADIKEEQAKALSVDDDDSEAEVQEADYRKALRSRIMHAVTLQAKIDKMSANAKEFERKCGELEDAADRERSRAARIELQMQQECQAAARREAERDEEIRTLRAALQQCQSKIELVVDDKKF